MKPLDLETIQDALHEIATIRQELKYYSLETRRCLDKLDTEVNCILSLLPDLDEDYTEGER